MPRGCGWQEIIAAIGVLPRDLFDPGDQKGGRGMSIPQNNRATVQPPTQAEGLTVEQYATARALPVDFLNNCGLSDVGFTGRPAVRIP